MFTHLHGHSHYSLLEAIGSPKAIIEQAVAQGMNSIGLTDYNGMYGAVEFYETCRRSDIKPILGVELALVHNHLESSRNEQAGHIVLLAQAKEGYQELLKLTSEANLNGFHEGKARIDKDLLKQHGGNLVAILGGNFSYLGKLIENNEDQDKIIEIIQGFKDILGEDNIYLEYIAQDEKKIPRLSKINLKILELSHITNTPCIVSSNFHYIHKNDQEIFEVALAIKDGKRIFDEDRRKISADRYLMNEDEVREIMTRNGLSGGQIDQLIQTNEKLSNSINIELDMGQLLFPKYDSPPEIRELYEKFNSDG